MNKSKNRIVRLLLILSLAFIFGTFSHTDVHAAYDTGSILKRAVVKDLMKCYPSYMTPKFAAIGDFRGASTLHNNGANSSSYLIPSGSVFSSIKDENLNCKDLVEGYSDGIQSIKSAFEIAGHAVPSGGNSAADFLTKYAGYKAVTNATLENGKCVYGKFTKVTYKDAVSSIQNKPDTQETVITNPICVEKITNGKIDSTPKMINNGGNTGYGIGFTGYGSVLYVDQNAKAVKVATKKTIGAYGEEYTYESISYTNVAWESFKNSMNSSFGTAKNSVLNHAEYETSYNSSYVKAKTTYAGIGEWESTEAAQQTSGYELDSSPGKKAAAGLLGVSESSVDSTLKISAQEQVHLYMYYLETLYKAKIDCSEIDESAASANNYQGPIKWFKGGETKVTEKCYITAHASRDNSGKNNNEVSGLSSNSGGTFTKRIGYNDLVEYFKTLSITELDDPAGTTAGEEETTESEKREIDCYSNAGALGWIVCPIIEFASNGVKMFYTGLVEPYLQIDAVLFDADSQGGATVQRIWGIFQGFANLAFVIVFLFVIFSQLTGVGIDNYGIKKILPKLIIGAVLINMSYLICQLAVDMSNILGRAVGSMFKNMGSDLDSTISGLSVNLYPEKAAAVTGKFEAGILVVVGIAAVLGVGAFLAAGPAILIPALLAVVSLAVGILFLFIMLALRQAIAVILVVISPMAFAAYILPNTKKLFDKWFEAFKGMLVAYPICAALVYGGDFVSKILLVSEGSSQITSLGIILSAAAVAIAPIFFIPSVIRKGMNGIAGIGNMVNKLQGNVHGAVRRPAEERLNQTWLNDYKTRRKEDRDAITSARRKEKNFNRAQRTMAKYAGKSPNELKAPQRARYNIARRNDMAYRKEQSELSDEYYSTLSKDGIANSIESAWNSGDLEMVTSGMNQLGQIDQEQLLTIVDGLSKTDKWKNMSDKERTAIMSTLRSQKGNPILQAYAKVLGGESSGSIRGLSDASMKKEVQAKIRDAGDGAVEGLDKDTANWIATNADSSWASSFTGDQMGTAIGSGMSGAQATGLAKVIAKRQEIGVDDTQFVSGEQLANGGNIAIASALSGSRVADIQDIANGTAARPDAQIQAKLGKQIGDIKANSELSAKTNEAFAQAAGIDRQQPQEVRIVP